MLLGCQAHAAMPPHAALDPCPPPVHPSFLARHGGRSLRLDIQMPNALLESSKAEVAALVCACLATCAAPRGQPGGGLRRLSISPGTPLPSTSCLPLLTALEALHLPGRYSDFCLTLDGSWRQLTALRWAHLSGRLLCTGSGPCLPPSLTKLRIEGDLTDADADDPPVLDENVSGCTKCLPAATKCESWFCWLDGQLWGWLPLKLPL